METILSRYHITVFSFIIGLGVLGSKAFPDVTVPMPWTFIALVLLAALISGSISFAGAARFSSKMLACENMRFSRFKGPKSEYRFINDGRMTWAVVPVRGWNYLKTKVNSAGNPGIAILPARLLEQESPYYPVGRVMMYRLTPRSISILSRKRTFGRLFTDLNYVQDGKTEVYMGFSSKSLHPDVAHVTGTYELNAYAGNLAATAIDLKRVSDDVQTWTKSQLRFWNAIRGSESAPIFVRGERRGRKDDEDEEER